MIQPIATIQFPERQQAPNGEWYLSPKAYQKKLGITSPTMGYWKTVGIPILGGEKLDAHWFRDACGRQVDYGSESQADRVIEARKLSVVVNGVEDMVPVAVAARRCNISVNRVRRLAHKKLIEAEIRTVYQRGKNNRHKQTVSLHFVSVASLRKYLLRHAADKRQAKTIADPISVAEAARLADVAPGTVNMWIRTGKIAHENLGHLERGGHRFVVGKSEVEALVKARRDRPSGDGEPWLYRYQIHAHFPELSLRIVEHHFTRKPRQYNIPPLGRPGETRPVDRPPWLRGRSKRVTQYARADLSALNAWVRDRPKQKSATPYPTTRRAIDFVEEYLADGKPHPLQNITAAASKRGIKRQWLISAVPFLKEKNLVVEKPWQGKKRFSAWCLPQTNTAVNGATPQTANAVLDPMPRRRGPETNNETLELGKFCYDRLHRKIARSVICREVHRLFVDRESFDESSVTIYARRYATHRKINKPWPV